MYHNFKSGCTHQSHVFLIWFNSGEWAPKIQFQCGSTRNCTSIKKSIFHLGHGNMYNLPNSHELRVGKRFLLSPPYQIHLQVPQESECWRSPTWRLQSQKKCPLKTRVPYSIVTRPTQNPQTHKHRWIMKGSYLQRLVRFGLFSFFSKNSDFSLLQLSVEILGLATLIQVMHLPERGTCQNIIPQSDSTSQKEDLVLHHRGRSCVVPGRQG